MKVSLQVGMEILVRDVSISLKGIPGEHVHGAGSAWVVLPVVRTESNKVIASFQIAKGGERRHVMCVGERPGLNPGPLGYQALRAANCARCPVKQHTW